MRNQPVPLPLGFYRDEDRPFSQQDVWNYMPCKAERTGTRSPLMLKTPPGLFPWLELTNAPPVRGIHDCEGRLFAVIGTTLYRLSSPDIAVPIGNVPGNGRVVMDHNQRASGQQLTIVNGSAGYVLDTRSGGYSRITDTGFSGSPLIRFMDGYMLGIDPAGRFAFNSAPAEATSYNTLDRWTSEYRPDRLVSMARVGGDLLLLSANSGEFFQNTGQNPQPYRSKRVFLDKGCAGPFTVAEADSTAFWLGSDGFFYQLDGYGAKRISTRPIEQAIRGQDWWNAFSFVWESEGHTCVCWTFLTGLTFIWDCSQQEWHRRESYGLERWRVNCTTRSNGQWFAGDFQLGRIWRIDWNYPWEGDTEFVSGFTVPVIHDNQNELIHHRLELVMDTGGVSNSPPDPLFPIQQIPPSISGSAPDGAVGVAYSYSYTTTEGSSSILRTTIDESALLPGLAWDQNTATLSGVPTAAGSMTITPRVTDLNGLWASLTDTIEVPEILPPRLSDWRYLQVESDDPTDYSGVGFDDSGWSVGTAPFGSWENGWGPSQEAEGAPTGLIYAPLYDGRFAEEFESEWETHTRLWLRRKLNLSAVPAGDLNMIMFIEDHCDVYVNGDLIVSTPPDHSGGIGQSFSVPASSLVAGENVIAIRCNDEADGSGISVVYVDLILELP